MYMCVRCIYFEIGFLNCSNSGIFFFLILLIKHADVLDIRLLILLIGTFLFPGFGGIRVDHRLVSVLSILDSPYVYINLRYR